MEKDCCNVNKVFVVNTPSYDSGVIKNVGLCETYVKRDECPLTHCMSVCTDICSQSTTEEKSGKFGGYIDEKLYIIKVIANKPAFVVLWSDGTKTTAKCSEDDKWDAEKGLAICVLKKLQSNTWVQQLFGDWAVEDGTWTLNDLRRMYRYFNKHKK